MPTQPTSESPVPFTITAAKKGGNCGHYNGGKLPLFLGPGFVRGIADREDNNHSGSQRYQSDWNSDGPLDSPARRGLRPTNNIERVNKENARRAAVVRILPTTAR